MALKLRTWLAGAAVAVGAVVASAAPASAFHFCHLPWHPLYNAAICGNQQTYAPPHRNYEYQPPPAYQQPQYEPQYQPRYQSNYYPRNCRTVTRQVWNGYAYEPRSFNRCS